MNHGRGYWTRILGTKHPTYLVNPSSLYRVTGGFPFRSLKVLSSCFDCSNGISVQVPTPEPG